MPEQQKMQFHADEIAVQKRLGLAEKVAKYGNYFIRQTMPEQHRSFFAELPFVILGMVDEHGAPWALPLFGEAGFISSSDDNCLHIAARPKLAQMLGLNFRNGEKIGMLGIQLNTRRRNRMNGVISNITAKGFDITVDQSFGNCPKYIQTRDLVWSKNESANTDFSAVEISEHIDTRSKAFIEQADTFFVASRTKTFSEDIRSGIDASHRGGKPGFIKVTGNKLCFPDFSGNKFFNTLGNIVSDGRVGLVFPNYANGDAIFATGWAEIQWNNDTINAFEGAERMIEVTIERLLYIPQFMPMTGKLIEQSPVLDATGTWGDLNRKNPSP